jgi:hypothetical protein
MSAGEPDLPASQCQQTQSAAAPPRLSGALAFYALGIPCGLALFLLAFPAGLLASIGILFYRGLAVLVIVTVVHALLLLLALRWLKRNRAMAGTGAMHVAPVVAVAAALNLAFFVLVPVNLDRAISVFLLSWMERQAGAAVARPELERAFHDTYIEGYRAIDRRIAEQLASGNIVASPEGFRLTGRGEAFVGFARAVGAIFGVDPRFLYPPPEAGRARAEPPPG